MSLYDIDYVVKNKYSRPAIVLVDMRGVVIHWTANPGATDTGHQDFFDGDDGGGERYAGAHMFVDKDSATLIIPIYEAAYHANEKTCKIDKLKAKSGKYQGDANLTTLGMELCVEKDGTIHPATLSRAEKIVAEWFTEFKLDPMEDIYRHYDITGKNCPRPMVENPAMFTEFKENVSNIMNLPITKPAPKEKVKSVIVKKPSKTYLEKGDRGTDVKNTQSLLEKLGYELGSIDGIFGANTEKAVRRFQSDHNLVVDGLVGKNTTAKLKQALEYPGHLIVKGSDDYKNVKLIQRKLGIYVDGKFGNGTYMAVRNFQAKHTLSVDGKVGKITWSKLFK